MKKVWYLSEIKPPFEGYRYTYASVQLDQRDKLMFETWRSQGVDGPIYDYGMTVAVVPVECTEVDVYSMLLGEVNPVSSTLLTCIDQLLSQEGLRSRPSEGLEPLTATSLLQEVDTVVKVGGAAVTHDSYQYARGLHQSMRTPQQRSATK